MATYAVGDIQGCHDQLRRLLDKAAFDPARDRLWSVGDLVNRGPKSLETLRFLASLGPAFTSVLGNHDLHFLATACGAHTNGKVKTLRPLLDAPDCPQLFAWMRSLPLAWNEQLVTSAGVQDFLLIHGGIAPSWSFRATLQYATEVSDALRGAQYRQFLQQMYGDFPDTWSADLAGIERLRVITNVLTRIRFCTAQGRLNLALKSAVGTAPPGYRPWYDFQPRQPGKVILFGHWATIDGHTGRDDIQGLDTGCVWGRCLTLLRLDDNQRISVSCDDV